MARGDGKRGEARLRRIKRVLNAGSDRLIPEITAALSKKNPLQQLLTPRLSKKEKAAARLLRKFVKRNRKLGTHDSAIFEALRLPLKDLSRGTL